MSINPPHTMFGALADKLRALSPKAAASLDAAQRAYDDYQEDAAIPTPDIGEMPDYRSIIEELNEAYGFAVQSPDDLRSLVHGLCDEIAELKSAARSVPEAGGEMPKDMQMVIEESRSIVSGTTYHARSVPGLCETVVHLDDERQRLTTRVAELERERDQCEQRYQSARRIVGVYGRALDESDGLRPITPPPAVGDETLDSILEDLENAIVDRDAHMETDAHERISAHLAAMVAAERELWENASLAWLEGGTRSLLFDSVARLRASTPHSAEATS